MSYNARFTASANRPALNIVIVGGGIAGLALALALAREGLLATVVESRSEAQVIGEGAFLTLAPNGMNALKALRLSEMVAQVGVETTGLLFHNERGRQVGLIDYREHATKFRAGSFTIPRGDLSGVLLNACRSAGLDLRFGEAVKAIHTAGAAVMVETKSWTERFDAVVGCDGLRSTVRSLIFPAAARPSYTGLIGTGGILDIPEVSPTGGLMKMTFGQRAFFGYLKAPGKPVFWFNSYPAPESDVGPIDDPVAYARAIQRLHEPDPLENSRIVAAVESIDRNYPLYDIPDLPGWSRGRVLLIGDAAHAATPHSGQGASLAIEDAVLLARCLLQAPDVETAFAGFERERRPRTTRAVEMGRMSGSQKHAQTWLARRVRDLVLPFFMRAAAKAQEELYAYRADLGAVGTNQALSEVS